MSKILELADAYARETYPSLITEARAALQAEVQAHMREYRNAALEEAAKVCEQFTHYGEASGIFCVKAIRELKEVQS